MLGCPRYNTEDGQHSGTRHIDTAKGMTDKSAQDHGGKTVSPSSCCKPRGILSEIIKFLSAHLLFKIHLRFYGLILIKRLHLRNRANVSILTLGA